jgi:hypothetical protein
MPAGFPRASMAFLKRSASHFVLFRPFTRSNGLSASGKPALMSNERTMRYRRWDDLHNGFRTSSLRISTEMPIGVTQPDCTAVCDHDHALDLVALKQKACCGKAGTHHVRPPKYGDKT